MAYDANKHQIFSDRVQNLARTIQSAREEALLLDAIYINETASGSDPAYIDNDNATAAEHTDMVLLMRSLKAFLENEAVATADRQQWLTAFLVTV